MVENQVWKGRLVLFYSNTTTNLYSLNETEYTYEEICIWFMPYPKEMSMHFHHSHQKQMTVYGMYLEWLRTAKCTIQKLSLLHSTYKIITVTYIEQ